jgi:hypothetical protein
MEKTTAAGYMLCRECGVGRLRLTLRPYVRLFQRQLYVIPDARCHQCDVCGVCEFDDTVSYLARKIMLGMAQTEPDEPLVRRPSAKVRNQERSKRIPPV